MPFGLMNAPISSKARRIILTTYKCKNCLVYLEDVRTFSNNVDDYLRHVDETLATLQEVEVTLKINKCHFFQCRGEFMAT